MNRTRTNEPLKLILALALLLVAGSRWTGCGCRPTAGTGCLPGRPLVRHPRLLVVNQVGYRLGLCKRALVVNQVRRAGKDEVALVDAATDEIVALVPPGPPERDPQTRDRIQIVDFSWFDQPGTYFLRQGGLRSPPFLVDSNPFQTTIDQLMRAYHYQRCGVPLADPHTGIAHPPCHLQDPRLARDDPYHRKGDRLHVVGGWHDAGDYGRYVSTTAVVVGRLSHLAEQYPGLLHDHLNIPESGNGIPDLLDETAVGLRWLLAMQRPDGAVYRKVAGSHWPAPGPPQNDTQPQYVYGISSHETAKAAAATAMAARVFRTWDPDLADRAIQFARRAWGFLERHPEVILDRHPEDDRGSGCYMTFDDPEKTRPHTDAGDRFWAAAELYLTTGEPTFRRYLEPRVGNLPYTLFGWRDPSALGMLDLYLSNQIPETWRRAIAARIMERAGYLLENVRNSGYRIATSNFVWGSNRNTAEDGVTLALAYRITGQRDYLDAAVAQADYLLGTNHFGVSFVTGVGSNPVQHLAHAFARARGVRLPGFLVGGPNARAEDGVAPRGRGPLSWVDNAESYATNENAIDYNPALVHLLAELSR